MSDDANRYLEMLEQRIALLQSLSGALHAARAAVVSCDIAGFEARITEQETLCGEVIRLDAQLTILRQSCGADAQLREPGANRRWDEKLRDAFKRLQLAGEAVKQETESHQAVVRRSRRTVTALLNSFQTFEGNYQSLVYLGPGNLSEPGGQV